MKRSEDIEYEIGKQGYLLTNLKPGHLGVHLLNFRAHLC